MNFMLGQYSLVLDPPIEQLDRHPPSASRCKCCPGVLPHTQVDCAPVQLQQGFDSFGPS